MKKFVIVCTWLHLGNYPNSAVYSVESKNKAAAIKKASAFAREKLQLSTFETFAEEITREKQIAICEQWEKLYRELDKPSPTKEIRDAYYNIVEFWRTVCF